MKYLFLLAELLASAMAFGRDIDAMIEQADSYVDTRPDSAVILADNLLADYGRKMTASQRAAALVVKSNGHFCAGFS